MMTPAHVLRLGPTPEPEKVNPLVLPGQQGDSRCGGNSLKGVSVGVRHAHSTGRTNAWLFVYPLEEDGLEPGLGGVEPLV